MAGKFYAVKVGKTPGIYTTWEDCKKMVDGFSGAVYKSFRTRGEAENFIGYTGKQVSLDFSKGQASLGVDGGGNVAADEPEVYAYVDGSFNAVTGVYGYGGFLMNGADQYILQGNGDDPEMASMRNVAGEILGSMAAVRKALELNLCTLTIYYDYLGIEMWATGAWKRNKAGTIAYHDYMQSVYDRIKIRFVKVKGHTGVEGNEQADRLAKDAVGL